MSRIDWRISDAWIDAMVMMLRLLNDQARLFALKLWVMMKLLLHLLLLLRQSSDHVGRGKMMHHHIAAACGCGKLRDLRRIFEGRHCWHLLAAFNEATLATADGLFRGLVSVKVHQICRVRRRGTAWVRQKGIRRENGWRILVLTEGEGFKILRETLLRKCGSIAIIVCSLHKLISCLGWQLLMIEGIILSCTINFRMIHMRKMRNLIATTGAWSLVTVIKATLVIKPVSKRCHLWAIGKRMLIAYKVSGVVVRLRRTLKNMKRVARLKWWLLLL